LSTSSITGSLLSSIANSPSTANQFVTDLNQLSKDLQSGNFSAGQNDYVTLSQDALNGATSSTATTSSSGITTALLSNIASSSSSASSFASGLNQLGADLGSGNLSSAQGDLLSLDSTALNAVPSSSPSSTSSATDRADISSLISATLQAMEVGDSSAIGTDMSQLASVSTSSAGAGYLRSDSASYGSSTGPSTGSGNGSSTGSSTPSAQSSISELLQDENADDSSSSGSSVSLLA
jgi:hypothetical protein